MNPSTPALPTRSPDPLVAAAALLGWFALALQLWLSIRLGAVDGRSAWSSTWIYLGYFTILTNLLVATALSVHALGQDDRFGQFFRHPGVLTAIAMNIVIVSLTYNVLLRQLWQPTGWTLTADVLLHDVMPVLFLLFWWLTVPKQNLQLRQLGRWMLYPLSYLIYALVRGAFSRWYPYPFIDARALGYARVLLNALFVALAFLMVALLLLALSKFQQRHAKPASAST